MAVTFHIPAPLREFTNGKGRVEIATTPNSVADALSELWQVYPGLRDRIATEQGDIRTHINIFVGDDDIRFRGGLTCRIFDGAEISIVPNITGGCDLYDGTNGTVGTQPVRFVLIRVNSWIAFPA